MKICVQITQTIYLDKYLRIEMLDQIISVYCTFLKGYLMEVQERLK